MARQPDAAADCRRGDVPGGKQRLDRVRARRERAVGREERCEQVVRRAHVAAIGGGPGQGRRRGAAAIEEDLDARTSPGSGLAERLGAAPAQGREHALDVLAGAEPVDAMVDAAAGIGEGIEAADLDLVEAAAAGLRTERAENRVRPIPAPRWRRFRCVPRQRRSAISSSSVVRQPCGGAGLSSTARAFLATRGFFGAAEGGGACTSFELDCGCMAKQYAAAMRGQSACGWPPPISP